MNQHRGVSVFSTVTILPMVVFLLLAPQVVLADGGDPATTVVPDAAGPLGHEEFAGNLPEAQPDIDVWYGSTQVFGDKGIPQPWVNILGRVSDPNGSLTYSLNGGPQQPLSIGPNGRRLADPGDFNVDIAYTELQAGNNEIVLSLNNASTKTVTVKRMDGGVWQNPYSIDWSKVTDIQDVAQVVDGLWEIKNGQVRTVGANSKSYDRLIAIGDLTWRDYEITVPITFHAFYGGDPGAGVLLRWRGHLPDSDQPSDSVKWGGLGWYRREPGETEHWLSIRAERRTIIAVDKDRALALGVPYTFKMQVKTLPDGSSRYSLKVWEAGEPEPVAWDITGTYLVAGYQVGSALLVAHRTDASFGDVTINPIGPGYFLLASVQPGNAGSVQTNPIKQTYDDGEQVTLVPQPDPGWRFSNWSGPDAGDLTKTGDNTWSLTMTQDRVVTANFAPDGFLLTVDVDPPDRGKVEKTPDQAAYEEGAVVKLRPVADSGWGFGQWTGPDAMEAVPNGDGTWSLTMDGDKQLTATFGEGDHQVTVVEKGLGVVQNTPGNPYPMGAVARLQPIPQDGWRFGWWSGANATDLIDNRDGSWSLIMNEDKVVTATFVKPVFMPLLLHLR